jgi:hypothetical protein
MLRLAGQGLLGAGLGAAIGGVSGAIGGAPSWVDHRITNGQPLQPESEEDWQQLKDTAGGYGQIGAWAGAGLGALAGIAAGDIGLVGGDDDMGMAIAGSAPPSGFGSGGGSRMAGEPDVLRRAWVAERPVVRPDGGVGGVAAIVPTGIDRFSAGAPEGGGPSQLSSEVGTQVMRALGRAVEDGRVGSYSFPYRRTPQQAVEEVGRLIGESLNALPADEAQRIYGFANTMRDPANAGVSGGEWDKRIVNLLYDEAGFRAALDAQHGPPATGSERFSVGTGDGGFSDHVIHRANSSLASLFQHPASSEDDRVLGLIAAAALQKHVGLENETRRAEFLSHAGNPEKMQAYTDAFRSQIRDLGYQADDWNPYSWMEGYDLVEANIKGWQEETGHVPERLLRLRNRKTPPQGR